MKPDDHISCSDFPCLDADREAYLVPGVEIDPQKAQVVMIWEVPPADAADHFYAPGSPLYAETTVQAFNDAGVNVATMQDVLDLGVYATTAVTCGKTRYTISARTVGNCSELLEREMALFPDIKVYLLMGDVAIKGMSYVWKRQSGRTIVPAGSTYRIRKQEFSFEGGRVFPSYLQTGKAFFIEKSKRRMIAEDIEEAVRLIG